MRRKFPIPISLLFLEGKHLKCRCVKLMEKLDLKSLSDQGILDIRDWPQPLVCRILGNVCLIRVIRRVLGSAICQKPCI
jgi:hypothetical protein